MSISIAAPRQPRPDNQSLPNRIEFVPPGELIVSKANARTHSKQQIGQIVRSIERFGFLGPVLIDDADQIIAGHGRVEAAKRLGLPEVPVVRITHLSAAERKAYAIADNRLAELAGWDGEMLAIELQELRELDFDLAAIGFELDDVDIVCNEAEKADRQTAAKTERGAGTSVRPVSGAGDVWLLGPHELRCAEAGDHAFYAAIDAAIQRWQRIAGEPAKLASADKTFAQIKKQRVSTVVTGSACRQAATKREAA
jgi:hypothetical protein